MESKTYDLKFHGWHKVTLTGDFMTGDTFEVRDFIKKSLGGKWDGERKGWIVDLNAVAKYASDTTIMVK